MHNFFKRLGMRLSQFMAGRYGVDALFLPLVIVSCVFTFISNFKGLGLFRLIGTIILCYALFRACSRNFDKRRRELYTYSQFSQKIRKYFRLKKKIYQERNIKKYFRCPNCKTYLCVPKGKGKLKIQCKKCHHEFIRKS